MAKFLRISISCLIILTCLMPAMADSGKELRIAALLPLTGPLSNSGVDVKRGMELAVESVSDGPIKPKLFFEDTQYDLKQAVTVANKVINQDHVDVVVSLWDQADVVAPITERAGILHIAIRWDPAVTKNRPLTFSIESTYITWVEDYLKLLTDMGVHSVTLIGEESASGYQLFNEFEKQAPPKGLKILARDMFTPTSADFRSILARNLALKPELIVLYAFPPNIELLIKQLKQLAPNQKYSGSLELVKDLKLIDGVVTTSIFGESAEFNTLFRNRFGEDFHIRAPHGYEVIRLITLVYKALWKDDKPSSKDAAGYLSAIKDFPSSLGPLTTGPNRNIEHPTTRRIAINGRWHDLKGNAVR